MCQRGGFPIFEVCLPTSCLKKMSEVNSGGGSSFTGGTPTTGHGNDHHPNLCITTVKLDETNYMQWAQSARMYITGLRLISHVNGTVMYPSEEDPKYNDWGADNALVMTWLLQSMQPQISKGFLFVKTVKELWDAVQETYSSVGNFAKLYELQQDIAKYKQGDLSLASYYHTLKGKWDEYDHYQDYTPVCAADVKGFQAMVERNRIYEFLGGLHPNYENARVQVLGRYPVPSSVREVFNYIQTEESRRKAMPIKPEPEVGLSERSALTTQQWNRNVPSKEGKQDLKSHLKCDHCGRARHTRETCWNLHGRPVAAGANAKQRPTPARGSPMAPFPSRGPPMAHIAANEPVYSGPSSNLSMHDADSLRHNIAHLQNRLAQLDPQPVSDAPSTSNFAQSGTYHSAHHVSTTSGELPWIIDSGATDHMTGMASIFSSYTVCSGRDKIRVADGTFSSIAGKGTISASPNITLSSVLHAPKLSNNLLSVSNITKTLNCSVTFFPSHCVFQDLDTGKTIGSGREDNGLYLLDSSRLSYYVANQSSARSSSVNKDLLMRWHNRLGHLPISVLKRVLPQFASVAPFELNCEPCVLAKQCRVSYPVSFNETSAPLQLVHSDVWGPIPTSSVFGFRYFVLFVDDFSRYTWLYLMKTKSEVHSIFKTFYKMVCTQFDCPLKILRSDNGGEFMYGGLASFFADNGIVHQTSCVDTPQQNGVVERKHCHITEVSRSLLIGMGMPKPYWADATLTAAYLINRMPSRVLGYKTPVSVLQPNSPLFIVPPKVFGCVCHVHIHHRTDKMDPKAVRCVFLGYSATQKGYRCYNPTTRRRYVSMDVTFFESVPFFSAARDSLQGETPLSIENPSFTQTECPLPLPVFTQGEFMPMSATTSTNDLQQGKELIVYTRRAKQTIVSPQDQAVSLDPGNPSSVDIDVPIALRKGVRDCTKHPISHFVSYNALSPTYRAFTSSVSSVSVPSNVSDALNQSQWKKAMMEEMEALEKNRTWDIVPLPRGKKPVGCKWVYTVKYQADGKIERYKARLVAKGYTQTHGIDYHETFAPVAKMNSIRVLISLAANLDWPLHQFDVKNAFLHGDLEEEVYMSMPPGFKLATGHDLVCKLNKALYGLKQSPRAWFERFSTAVMRVGYTQSQADHTLFIKRYQNRTTALIVYVDDIVMTGDDPEEIQRMKSFLGTEFEVKDLGLLRYFLGIEVCRSKRGVFISQRKYVLDLLTETGKLGARTADTPIEQNHKLNDMDGELLEDVGRFQRLVGRLIYLSLTRPDIAYAVSVISQFMHAPRSSHLEAVHHILRYLKGSPGKGILFGRHGHLRVEAYTDADWAGSVTDRRSTSGYCTFVGGNLVSWRSKKQPVVARSSAEAEFRSMAHGVCELLWLRTMLAELGYPICEPMNLYCDNKAAISIAHNPVQHDRTKHIEVDRHFIKEKLHQGLICTPYVSTGEQVADVLTKGVSKTILQYMLVKLGMIDIFAPT